MAFMAAGAYAYQMGLWVYEALVAPAEPVYLPRSPLHVDRRVSRITSTLDDASPPSPPPPPPPKRKPKLDLEDDKVSDRFAMLEMD